MVDEVVDVFLAAQQFLAERVDPLDPRPSDAQSAIRLIVTVAGG